MRDQGANLVSTWRFPEGRAFPPRSGIRPLPVPRESMMRFYTGQHRFYCGIDLHARLPAVCVVEQAGTVVLRKHIPDDQQQLRELLAPSRPDVVLAVECLLAWYWVADFCAAELLIRGADKGPFLVPNGKHARS